MARERALAALGVGHAHPTWLNDKCASCQAAKWIRKEFRVLEAEVLKWKKAADGVWDHVWAAKARAERAEARLAEVEPFLGFLEAMRSAMLKHHIRIPSDGMEPWIQHDPGLLRDALRREYGEWAAATSDSEEKELVDVANCAYFVWRFLSNDPAGRGSGSEHGKDGGDCIHGFGCDCQNPIGPIDPDDEREYRG